jgi:hypothetical protein
MWARASSVQVGSVEHLRYPRADVHLRKDRSMTSAVRILAAVGVAGWLAGAARAEDDDDDPKSAPRHAPVAKPERPAPPKAPPPVEKPPPVVQKAPAEKAPPAVEKAAPADKPAAKLAVTGRPAPAKPMEELPPTPIKRTLAAPEPAAKKTAPEPSSTPGKKTAAAPAASSPLPPGAPVPIELPAAASPRTVRVRLLDGSTVVGLVRAEQERVLVIDCSLGQLSIPRERISTIAYDAAAGIGSKRAPVQQLDDDEHLPKKRGQSAFNPTIAEPRF